MSLLNGFHRLSRAESQGASHRHDRKANQIFNGSETQPAMQLTSFMRNCQKESAYPEHSRTSGSVESGQCQRERPNSRSGTIGLGGPPCLLKVSSRPLRWHSYLISPGLSWIDSTEREPSRSLFPRPPRWITSSAPQKSYFGLSPARIYLARFRGS